MQLCIMHAVECPKRAGVVGRCCGGCTSNILNRTELAAKIYFEVYRVSCEVLDIGSKASIYRNIGIRFIGISEFQYIEISEFRYIEISDFDISDFRHFKISDLRCIEISDVR